MIGVGDARYDCRSSGDWRPELLGAKTEAEPELVLEPDFGVPRPGFCGSKS